MIVKREDYIKALVYLKDICNPKFFDEMKETLEELSLKYKDLEDLKRKAKKEKDEENYQKYINEMKNVTKQMQDIIIPYRKDFFYINVKKVIAYKNNLNIEEANSFHFNMEDADSKVIIKAIENINSYFLTSVVIAAIYGTTRQYIHQLFITKKFKNYMIGQVVAIKLFDVIELGIKKKFIL